MAKAPLQQRLREYFVYDAHIKTLGGAHPIVVRGDDARIVVLTKAQAQYWLDQHVIGEQPLAELSTEGRDLLHQFTRGRVARDDGDKKDTPEGPLVEPDGHFREGR